jgi:hypothetical protein
MPAPSPTRRESGPGLWQRLTGGGRGGAGRRPPNPYAARAADPRRPTGLSPTAKGALFALGGVVLAVFAVLGVIVAFKWMWPEKPDGTVTTRSGPEGPTSSVPATTTTPVATWTMTIYKPDYGTVYVQGTPIACGSKGNECTAELEDGFPVVLRREPDAGYQFLRYTGQCGDNGEVSMTKALSCGATFQKALAVIDKLPPPPTPPQVPQRPVNPGVARGTDVPKGGQDQERARAGGPPDTTQNPPPRPAPETTTTAVVVATGTATPPPILTPEYYAKRDILQLVLNYCAAHESRKPEAMKRIYPSVDTRKLKDQYGDLDLLKCVAVPPEDLDPVSAAAKNVAQFHFVMKQKLKSKASVAPKDAEFDVTMVVSRKDVNSDWLIARADVAPKPKD